MTRTNKTICLGALVLCAAACSKHPDRDTNVGSNEAYVESTPPAPTSEARNDERQTLEGDTATTAEREPTAGTDSAVARIADARCSHEERCNNIGMGKTYRTKADCTAQLKSQWRDDLEGQECQNGMDWGELNTCLTAIRDDACATAFQPLSRLPACHSSELCKH